MSASCSCGAPTSCSGYWNKPEANAETFTDGWLHTGDVARIDEDGLLYIVDRKKDMINRGGENVYSIEVENVARERPGGRRSRRGGGARRHDGREGRRGAGGRGRGPDRHQRGARPLPAHLADFKVPQYIAIREEPLPRNPAGKLLKGQLRKETRWGEQYR